MYIMIRLAFVILNFLLTFILCSMHIEFMGSMTKIAWTKPLGRHICHRMGGRHCGFLGGIRDTKIAPFCSTSYSVKVTKAFQQLLSVQKLHTKDRLGLFLSPCPKVVRRPNGSKHDTGVTRRWSHQAVVKCFSKSIRKLYLSICNYQDYSDVLAW